MKTADLERALAIAKAAAIEAGDELINHFGNIAPTTKSGAGDSVGNIVTELDRQTETLLAQRLGSFDRAVGFRGEEFGAQRKAATTWLVDPIDGTSHFVRGLPFCTTMISLIEDDKVVLAIIYDFVQKDMYWALKGQGAYKNDQKIHVSSRPLKQAMLSFETRLDNAENRDLYLRVLKSSGGGIFNTINSGYDFAMVASGKLDGKITKRPYGYDWDFAPGSLLVAEAGGTVANHGSKKYDYANHDFIAANPQAYQALTTGADAIFPL